jgi:hypothetical protein
MMRARRATSELPGAEEEEEQMHKGKDGDAGGGVFGWFTGKK